MLDRGDDIWFSRKMENPVHLMKIFGLEPGFVRDIYGVILERPRLCLLYTSDAADERSSVDLGGRRIIKKKNKHNYVVRYRT